MKVKELIAELQKHDGEMEVFYNQYYDSIDMQTYFKVGRAEKVESRKISINPNKINPKEAIIVLA